MGGRCIIMTAIRIFIGILVFLLILSQYRLWVGEGSYAEVHEIERAITEQKQENAKLRERNAALAAEVIDLKQGLDAIEERARNDLGMIKKGEIFVQIIEKKKPK